MPNSLSLNLPGSVPIALLPVRLETRFTVSATGDHTLLIRIYVDDIHRDTHEAELTTDEHRWGQIFWQDTWRAGLALATDPGVQQRIAQELAAWKQLASRFGPTRAAHIAQTKTLTPTNSSDRPPGLNLDGPLASEPEFPPVGVLRAASWTRAAQARCLPDSWLAIGTSGAQSISQHGLAIPATLAIGPNPSIDISAGNPPPNNAASIDPDIRWLIDFDEAVNKGMGIRMPLSAEVAAAGLDRLIVLGVRQAGNAEAGAADLQQLLDAHRYTWGLALVPQGTPTNNTEDTRSGYSREDIGFQTSFALRQQAAPRTSTDGGKLAAALGLSSNGLAGLAFTEDQAQADAEQINQALWPVSLGYFVEQFLNGLFPEHDTNRWRDFFVAFVRARGPLPAIRIGRQPYAVLPATSLDGWGADAPALMPLLRSVRDLWRQAISDIPRAARDTASAGRDLVEVLGQQPRSTAYTWRWGRGGDFVRNFWRLPGQEIDANALNAALVQVGDHVKAALQQIGLVATVPPRISTISFADVPIDDTGPLVQDMALPSDQPLQFNYIATLADPTVSLTDIHDETAVIWPDAAVPKPLLYRLLRHATLLAYAEQALENSLADPLPPFGPPGANPPWFDPELIDGIANPPTRTSDVNFDSFSTMTFWRVLQSPMPDPRRPDQSISRGDFLRQTAAAGSATALGGFLSSLRALSALPAASLETLASEAIDLASHRLDAWITALASSQLAKCRALPGSASSLFIGGYGWVENLRPRASSTSDGFIHAPSIGQANAAAVLRSGYLAHRDQAEGARLQIDLSSRRVREALRLVDGVRQGQPLGALLGYRLEKRLHNLKLDGTIDQLRELAPLLGGKQLPRSADEPLDAIAANNVVDGAKLLERFRTEADLLAPFGQDRQALEGEMMSLKDAVDAISDLGLAEGVYQAVQGNYARAGSTLDAISRGDTPGDFEVLRTPRSGTGFTQRIVVLLDAAMSAANEWNPAGPRSTAEPALSAWAARLLGPPSRVKFSVAYFNPGNDPSKNAPDAVKTFALSELLPLPCALDIVYAPRVTDQPLQTEFELRLAGMALKQRDTPIAANAQLALQFSRKTFGGDPDDLTLPDLFELGRTVRELLVNARALQARDLAVAGSADDPRLALDLLQARYANTLALWNSTKAALDEQLASVDKGQAIDPQAMRGAMEGLYGFAVQHAVPTSPSTVSESEQSALLDQARQVCKQVATLAARLPVGQAATLSAPTLMEAFGVLFGEGFRVASPFRLGATSTYSASLKQRVAAADAGPLETAEWLRAVSTVRDGARRLRTVQLLADVVSDGSASPLRVAQFPITSARWNSHDDSTRTGATSIVASMPGADAAPPTLPSELAGLMVDEWVEIVPHASARTGLAFHHDAPGATAPQAILLAVAPDITQTWTEDMLAAIVTETLELAKLRMIDYDRIPALGHMLPAIYLANNVGGAAGGDTVSTRLN